MISVCMATYNGSKYIDEQISSILNQLTEEDELIISDDNSQDETLTIVRSFNDKRIKLYHSSFRSHIRNFENALSKARGNYIFLADQDDIWMNNKVFKSLEYLKQANLVLSDCILIDGNKNVLFDSYFAIRKVKTGLHNNFYRNSYTGCCMAFDRKILDKCLPFPSKIKSHDSWIGLIAELYGTTCFINEPLIYLRRHGMNFSTNSGSDSFLTDKSKYKLRQIIIQRLYLLFSLFSRNFRKTDVEK